MSLKVAHAVVATLFSELGVQNAETWPAAKMVGKLKKLKDIVDDDTEVEDKAAKKLLKQLTADASLIDTLEIEGGPGAGDERKDKGAKAKDEKKGDGKKSAKAEDDEEDDEDEKSKKDDDEDDDEEDEKASKKDEKKGDGKKKPAKAKKETAKDGLGCRIPSQAHSINECLSKKPKTVDKIAEEASLPSYRVKSHLASLVTKKLIVDHGEKGFSLKA